MIYSTRHKLAYLSHPTTSEKQERKHREERAKLQSDWAALREYCEKFGAIRQKVMVAVAPQHEPARIMSDTTNGIYIPPNNGLGYKGFKDTYSANEIIDKIRARSTELKKKRAVEYRFHSGLCEEIVLEDHDGGTRESIASLARRSGRKVGVEVGLRK